MNYKNLKDENIIGNIRNLLKQSKEICEAVDENGDPFILYAHAKVGFCLTTDKQRLKTIINSQGIFTPIKQKMIDLRNQPLKENKAFRPSQELPATFIRAYCRILPIKMAKVYLSYDMQQRSRYHVSESTRE